MREETSFSVRRIGVCLLTMLVLFSFPGSLPADAKKIHLDAKFQPGDTLYYQIEMHTVSTGKTTTPIINPEGGTKFSENVDLLVRLDVLPVAPASPGGAKSPKPGSHEPARLRVTYVRAHADSQSDAPDFDTASPSREYNRLEGHSFEFTLEPGGAISDVQDIDGILPNAADGAQALSWVKNLSSGTALPRKGIAIGQKWISEKPLSGAPLTGLMWRAESTYLRNETCRASAAASKSESGAQTRPPQCAVILTRFRIFRRGPAHAEETPPDYLRHGLRTMGTVTGSGESLDSVALDTGLLLSSTQTSVQNADFDIINAASGEKIHRVGQVKTQTIITRVAPPQPAKH